MIKLINFSPGSPRKKEDPNKIVKEETKQLIPQKLKKS